MTPPDTLDMEQPQHPAVEIKGQIAEDSRGVSAISENDKANEVVKRAKISSDYFNTLAQNEPEPKLIKAIIDEDIKAVDGSRVHLRLLDDVEINECIVKRAPISMPR